MRVKIGPYKSWFGPFQLAEMIPFISEDSAFRIGEWLSNTWVDNFCQWVDSKRNRKVKIHIDRCDTWNMDHTLALIIHPMLKQLKETKLGSHYVEDEDVPEHMRYGDPNNMGDNWVHYKWEWVLNELIWTFEQLSKDDDKSYTLDSVKFQEYNDRINNGLRLFGRYYRGLWD